MAVTLTQILFHVVFSTKHRARLINAQVREELYAFIADTVRRHGGQLVAIGGMPDHVHLPDPAEALCAHLIHGPVRQGQFLALAAREA